jgi:hypothetical protein
VGPVSPPLAPQSKGVEINADWADDADYRLEKNDMRELCLGYLNTISYRRKSARSAEIETTFGIVAGVGGVVAGT